jgi:hypothetical protein
MIIHTNLFISSFSSDDRNSSTPGTSRIAEGVKSRSARKKRRTAAGTNAGGGEEDDDYAYKPDELAFSKSVYFKVEKLLTQWGWGRWATMKQTSDLGEHDLEHISRQFLLEFIYFKSNTYLNLIFYFKYFLF